MKPILYALAAVAVFAGMAGMFWAAVRGHEWLVVALYGVIVVAGMAAQREVEK